MSSIVDKVKNALSDEPNATMNPTSTAGTYNATKGTYGTSAGGVAGPHHSRIANVLDPRVDSTHVGGAAGTTATRPAAGHTGGHHAARDAAVGSAAVGLTEHEHHKRHSTTKPSHTGRDAALAGAGIGIIQHERNKHDTEWLGPHSSSLLNRLDPRVDSSTGMVRGHGTKGPAGTTSGTTMGVTGPSYNPNTDTAGGLRSSTNAGYAGAPTQAAVGTEGSYSTPGSGTAQNTAGPHNSDIANRLDPRVDSNLDGSRTYGGNRTYAQD